MRYVSFSITAILAMAILILPSCGNPVTETITLQDIHQINETAFGRPGNKYAWSMATLNDTALFVGTNNFDLLNEAPPDDPTLWKGCEIWRYDGATWTPVVEEGLNDRNNLGVRDLKELNGCLYATTMNLTNGMELWRSCNGTDWETLVNNGFGLVANNSGRGLAYYKGHLYVGTINPSLGAQIWRSTDGTAWDQVASGGISDSDNTWISDLIEYNGWLYAGTANSLGMQLYRTDDGVNYERIFEGGAGVPQNTHAMVLYEFNNKLFISTMNLQLGFYLYMSDNGINFTAVLQNGFTHPKNNYIWSLQEYNGRLYAGSFYNDYLFFGHFQLYSSADGIDWIVENTNALGYTFNYGLRSMDVFDNKLIMGTTSFFSGCRVIEATAK